MKFCTKCETAKTVDEFYRQGAYYAPHCKVCRSAYDKQRRASFTPEQREQYDAQMRERHLRLKYGISEAEYLFLFAEQEGVCKICGKPEAQNKQLAVDHDHLTGKVRGLLCMLCNTRIGYFEHHDLIPAVLQYLELGAES